MIPKKQFVGFLKEILFLCVLILIRYFVELLLFLLHYFCPGSFSFVIICFIGFPLIRMVGALGLLQHNTTDWVAYKQCKFISYSSRGWGLFDQGVSKFDVWWRPASLFICGHPLPMSSHGRNGEGTLWGLFYKGTNSIHRNSTLVT